jgi:pilus assembly protein CpaF
MVANDILTETPCSEPDVSHEPEARLAELRFSTESGRLRHWRRPVAETLARAGLGEGFTIGEWADTPWYGPLESWLAPGTTVSDILVNGPERDVMIVERGHRLNSGVVLCDDWLRWTQRQLLLRAGYVTTEAPDDWRDADGRPVHALHGTADRRLRFAVTRPPYTPDGPTIAVRILPSRWRTLDDLVHHEVSVLSRAMADLLCQAIRHGVTVLVAGTTGSGKTTLTAALLQAIAEDKRVIVVEDARELPLPPDGMAIEVLRSRSTFASCVRMTLRQKPDLIVVGEVRGAEALALLQAAATGHPGIGTIHAPDALSGLRNLERMASESGEASAEMVRGMLTSKTIPLLVAHIGHYAGRRQLGEIVEVLVGGQSKPGDPFPHQPIYRFQPQTQRVERVGSPQGAWGAAWGVAWPRGRGE